MRTFAILLCLSLAAITAHGKKGKSWAFLVASANTWYNYGMQADVYHAYQVFKQGGIPEENIIVMAFDDIADKMENPYRGQIFQSYDLKDVYSGVKIDYKTKTVNKETFAAILKGDKAGVKKLTGREGKVVDSGPDDNVFVFISNHGGPGVVCWLDGNDMTAKELNNTIAYLHKNNRYKSLVFYLDTCYSGSMFENILPNDIGVYAASAANATSYAYSTDCQSKAFENNPTCLGGLFSINWVYEIQSDDRSTATMDMQFQEAFAACEGNSVPKQYGDLSITSKMQTEFFGNSADYKKPVGGRRSRRSTREEHNVPKHMLVHHSLLTKVNSLPEGSEESDKLTRVENLMGNADQFIRDVSASVYGRETDTAYAETHFGAINWNCYEPVMDAVKARCPKMMFDEEVRYYALSKFGVFINLCNEITTEKVLEAVDLAAKLNPVCEE